MQINSDHWQLKTESIEQKSELLDFAESCGVKVPHKLLGYHTDSDAYLSWFGPSVGLGTLPKRHQERMTEIVTPMEFRQACLAYQAAFSAKHSLASVTA